MTKGVVFPCIYDCVLYFVTSTHEAGFSAEDREQKTRDEKTPGKGKPKTEQGLEKRLMSHRCINLAQEAKGSVTTGLIVLVMWNYVHG